MRDPIDDGGPAFPCDVVHDYSVTQNAGGMSVRDYFAAKAMVIAWNWALEGDLTDIKALELSAAERAYSMADAMLKARKA